jgi:hypothetical protein
MYTSDSTFRSEFDKEPYQADSMQHAVVFSSLRPLPDRYAFASFRADVFLRSQAAACSSVWNKDIQAWRMNVPVCRSAEL